MEGWSIDAGDTGEGQAEAAHSEERAVDDERFDQGSVEPDYQRSALLALSDQSALLRNRS